MITDYKIQKFSENFLPSLTQLLDDSFSIQNENKPELVKWKYFDRFLKNKTITYIALSPKEKVISHYTNLPLSINYLHKSYQAMICTDMCTDKNYRGKGLISKLSSKVYNEVYKNKYDFSIGFSNDEGINVDKHSANYGYVIVGKFVRYFKIVLTRKKVKYLLKKTSIINKNLDNYSKYLKINKDHDYLLWRYLRKPKSEYDVYGILEKDINVGYVVLRFINKKCYVYDIISSSQEKSDMVSILRSIENKALDHKTRLIIYNVLDNDYWKNLFNRYKYFKKTNNKINYYLTIKIHNKNLVENFILNKENWLLMNGDIL